MFDKYFVTSPESKPFSGRARLITAVYSELGIVPDKHIDQMQEELAPVLAAHDDAHPMTETFITVNLDSNYPLRALLTAFDKKQRKTASVWKSPWDLFDLNQLNRRTMSDTNTSEPKIGTVRGMVLTTDHRYSEPGLILTNRSIEEQRTEALNATPLNITDYVIVQALRREEGKPPLDCGTFTRFPQLEATMSSGASVVAVTDMRGGSELMLSSLGGAAFPDEGVRFSVGQ